MKNVFLVSLLAFSFGCCTYSSASGQDIVNKPCSTLEKADKTSGCVVMRFGGRQGVWLVLERSEQLRKEHLAYPQLQLQIENLSRSLAIEAARASLYKNADDERKEANELFEKQLKESQLREQACYDRADSFWRKPIVWFAIGAALSTAITISVASAVN